MPRILTENGLKGNNQPCFLMYSSAVLEMTWLRRLNVKTWGETTREIQKLEASQAIRAHKKILRAKIGVGTAFYKMR